MTPFLDNICTVFFLARKLVFDMPYTCVTFPTKCTAQADRLCTVHPRAQKGLLHLTGMQHCNNLSSLPIRTNTWGDKRKLSCYK